MKSFLQIAVLLVIVLPVIIFSQNNVYVTQIDTIKIHKSYQPLIFSTIIDTVGRDYFITKIEIYDPRKETLLQFIKDTSSSHFGGGQVTYIDINFDGFNDIEIDCGASNLIPIYSFWIYDKDERKYFYSKEFSCLNDYDIDIENKEITSVSQATGGSGGYWCTYLVKNGKLVKILDNYEYWEEHVTNVYSNNEIVQSIRWKKNEYTYAGEVLVFDKYAINGHSEVLIEKSWRIDKGTFLFSDDNTGVIIKDVNGIYYQLLKKEFYYYEEIGIDTLLRKTRKYKAIESELKEVSEF